MANSNGLRDVAIVGIGATPYYKRGGSLPKTITELAPELTLVPAVVDLPDAPGARLVTNIIDISPTDVAIGMPLRVAFSPIAGGWMLPVLRAADVPKE